MRAPPGAGSVDLLLIAVDGGSHDTPPAAEPLQLTVTCKNDKEWRNDGREGRNPRLGYPRLSGLGHKPRREKYVNAEDER
jgi:hypothetical protein